MIARPFRTLGLGAALALVTSFAHAQQSPASPPAPNTMQVPSPMTMPPGAQPMTNPEIGAQGGAQPNPMERACRQKWQQIKASGAKNGQTRDQFLTNCMQGH
jgi:hypothetical protein